MRQYEGYDPAARDDRKLCEAVWKLLDEADIVIGQNSIAFDEKKLNLRFLFHRLGSPSPYQSFDILRNSRSKFAYPSHKLDDRAEYHGIEGKLSHTGKHLWFGCMAGNVKDWALMEKYNKRDIEITRKLYDLEGPWSTNHPNINIISRKMGACPFCGSSNLLAEGYRHTLTSEYQRFSCKDCGKWSRGKPEPLARKVQIR